MHHPNPLVEMKRQHFTAFATAVLQEHARLSQRETTKPLILCMWIGRLYLNDEDMVNLGGYPEIYYGAREQGDGTVAMPISAVAVSADTVRGKKCAPFESHPDVLWVSGAR